MKRVKFDRSLCEKCKNFYTGYNTSVNSPFCHIQGKKIYEGECHEYESVEEKPSNKEMAYREYEKYQEAWN